MVILTKRRKFVLSSFLLSFGLYLYFVFVGSENKYQAVAFLSFLTGLLTFWSLRGAAFGLATWITPILPALFTAGVTLFYFLLPANLLTIIPIIAIYFIGMYSLFLTENIFSVAAIRTINLFRTASAAGFVLILLTTFFLYNTLLSLKLAFHFNFLLTFLISFPLIFCGLWSVNLEEKITLDLISASFLTALLLAELGAALSFWPVTLTMGSSFLTTGVYVLLGLTQTYLGGRLFKGTETVYLIFGLAVFLTMIFLTPWG